jgi:hypothetical protein
VISDLSVFWRKLGNFRISSFSLTTTFFMYLPQNSFNAWSSKVLETANIKEFQVNWKCPPCTAVCTHQHAAPRCGRSTSYHGVLYFQNVIRFHATRASIIPFTPIKYHTFFHATQNAQQRSERAFCTELHRNRTINVESKDTNSLRTCSTVRLSQRWFSRNCEPLQIVWTLSV